MLVRLLDKLRLVRGITLMDFEGKVYETILQEWPVYGKWAYVYPFTKIGHVRLQPDGTVRNHYVRYWKYMRES